MKFVPVDGTSVQSPFGDTRVQDYQAFVTATGRSLGKTFIYASYRRIRRSTSVGKTQKPFANG